MLYLRKKTIFSDMYSQFFIRSRDSHRLGFPNEYKETIDEATVGL